MHFPSDLLFSFQRCRGGFSKQRAVNGRESPKFGEPIALRNLRDTRRRGIGAL
jgi:hypothetical protein